MRRSIHNAWKQQIFWIQIWLIKSIVFRIKTIKETFINWQKFILKRKFYSFCQINIINLSYFRATTFISTCYKSTCPICTNFLCSYVQKNFKSDMSNPKCIFTKIENLLKFEWKHCKGQLLRIVRNGAYVDCFNA